jgi:hypothetical protein
MDRTLNNKIWIRGLVMECPHGTPAQDCPLNGLRSLPISEANRVINEMSIKQVNAYMKTHRKCYNHRQEAQSA